MIKAMEFTLFDGHLPLLQPAAGYRTALDPVLLAATVHAERFSSAHILDLGCGIGTIGFCLMTRFPCKVTGVDLQPDLLQLARKNAANLSRQDDIKFIESNVQDLQLEEVFDAVVTNPPYVEIGRGSPNVTDNRRLAHLETIPFFDWAKAAARHLKQGGYFYIIHRADRLHDLLESLRRAEFGSFSVLPLYPRAGENNAKRVIISCRKRKRAPLRLLQGLVLHEGQSYTDRVCDIIYRMQPLIVD